MIIWFNHWFSTVYWYITSIKQELAIRGIDTTIIGTNDRETFAYSSLCAKTQQEPIGLEGLDYVYWCVEFCKVNNVNLFIPYKHGKLLAENKQLFIDIGVKVLVDNTSNIASLLDDKIATMSYFKEHNICETPVFYKVTNVSEFVQAYENLKAIAPDDRVCFKYAVDKGACSFRVVEDKVDLLSSLKAPIGAKISYNSTIAMLSSVPEFPALIVMPYLVGVEVSIDSLMTSEGFIGIPRYKVGSRYTRIEFADNLIAIAKRFAEVSGIRHPFNVQIKFHNDRPYILEVNARLAGGTYLTSLTGINIPVIAILDLLGLPFSIPNNVKNITATVMETPVVLQEDYVLNISQNERKD